MIKEKTFQRALMEFSKHPEKMKAYLTDRRPSQLEKTILTAYLLLRKNKNKEALKLLLEAESLGSEFVESQRYFVMGAAANNLCDFKRSEEYLTKAVSLLEGSQAEQFLFAAYYASFWVMANLSQVERMSILLGKMDKFPHFKEDVEAKLLRCRFCLQQMNHSYQEARATSGQVDILVGRLSEYDQASYLVDKFILMVQLEDFDECFDILDQMKKVKHFSLTENYNFMKSMLLNFTKSSPIYAYEKDYRNTPMLFQQLMVIQSLESAKTVEAKKYWEELANTNKQVYQKDFCYVGEKCLFSLCLEKYRHVWEKQEIKVKIYDNKLETLIYLLQHNSTPLTAEQLFKHIWQRDVQDKEDLRKVSRLVSRVKVEQRLDVQFTKGTYFLVTSKNMAS